MKIGDCVLCKGYLKRSGNYYDIQEEQYPIYHNKGDGSHETIEEDHTCDKYVIARKSFSGIYVGRVKICTELLLTLQFPPYGRERWEVTSEKPVDCAVVYYVNNRKRFVPLEFVEEGATK